MRSDLVRALAGQPVQATPLMSDDEKTTILAAAPGGYGGGYGRDDRWDDDDEDARRRRRRTIAIVSVLASCCSAVRSPRPSPSAAATRPPTAAQVQVPRADRPDRGRGRAPRSRAPASTVGDGRPTRPAPPSPRAWSSAATPPAAPASTKGSKVDAGRQQRPGHRRGAQRRGPDRGPRPQHARGGRVHQRELAPDRLPRGRGQRRRRRSRPRAQQAARNATITLQVSTGTIKVPDVTGKTEADARKALTDAGFSAGQIQQAVDERRRARGDRRRHRPRAGHGGRRGDTITLQIATAPASSPSRTSAGRTGTRPSDPVRSGSPTSASRAVPTATPRHRGRHRPRGLYGGPRRRDAVVVG